MTAADNQEAVNTALNDLKAQRPASLFGLLAETVVWNVYEDNPLGGTYNGPTGVQAYLGKMEQVTISSFTVDAVLAQNDQVVALATLGYTVNATEKSTSGITVVVFDFTGAKISEARVVAAGTGGAWTS